MRKVRKLRHWKQRFDKNAAFVWRKGLVYQGQRIVLGAPIPKELADSPTKLRRFWESGTIELAEFDAPNVATGQVETARDQSKAIQAPKKRGRRPKHLANDPLDF